MECTFKKLNKVIIVAESEKDHYLASGYDMVKIDEETGKYTVVEEATSGKTYTVAEYNRLKSKNESLEAEVEKLKAENKKLKTDITKLKKPAEKEKPVE